MSPRLHPSDRRIQQQQRRESIRNGSEKDTATERRPGTETGATQATVSY